MSEYGTKREIISKDRLVEMMLILIIVAFVGTIGNFVTEYRSWNLFQES